ncbi:glycosyltransferase family 1 protein [Sphaerospermopsis kisseleviana CS-549]|uniref:Glycosyltransferase family 1 protein n=1 Tax=Sphaerospermopsis kisseleviana CS-549 TaxID=3021783 RepID=A0ABT4ZRY8_9CYAN|nr:glycosyltransferase family 1 protein [Sphaerospermopsis kisseleviana]MDB9442168.1 glycosyltransferase family 1 protein [Sphaerospermopsis kisseleviana CS-549]BAZ82392.1 group 1 glycosyl transferase [Sphaerospermopsis kisseleviana NIES-73]
MRIGLLVNAQISPQSGGAYTFGSQLLQAFLQLAPESGHTIILFTRSHHYTKHLGSSLELVSLDWSLKARIKSKILALVQEIFRKLRSPSSKFILPTGMELYEKYILDLLIANQVQVNLSLTPETFPVLDVPYIIPIWDLQHRLQPYFPEVSTMGAWDRRENYFSKVLKRATFILTGTEVGKAEIEKFYQVPSERIKVIPFFTPQLSPVGVTSEDLLNKYSIPPNYLFYPAQFCSHKNHIGLLLAVKTLQQKYALALPLVLVGSGTGHKSYVEAMAKELNLSSQVHFLGFVPQEDMAPLYRNAFALTFVTFFGPDNLPPLEAMSLGCPVIASDVPGAQEQLGDAAFLVDPKKPEDIASAIKLLWEDNSLRQNLIAKGLARSQKWTVEDYAKQIFAVIDEFEAIRRCW